MEPIGTERKVESGSRLATLDRKGIIGGLAVVAAVALPGRIATYAEDARESLAAGVLPLEWARAWLGELAQREAHSRRVRKLEPLRGLTALCKVDVGHGHFLGMLPTGVLFDVHGDGPGRTVSYEEACAIEGRERFTVWLCAMMGIEPDASADDVTASVLRESYPGATPAASEVRT